MVPLARSWCVDTVTYQRPAKKQYGSVSQSGERTARRHEPLRRRGQSAAVGQAGRMARAMHGGSRRGARCFTWAGSSAEAAYARGDYATAFKIWLPLAEQGSAQAQLNVARMY